MMHIIYIFFLECETINHIKDAGKLDEKQLQIMQQPENICVNILIIFTIVFI